MNEPLDSRVVRSPIRKAKDDGLEISHARFDKANMEYSLSAVFFTALDYVLSDLRKK